MLDATLCAHTYTFGAFIIGNSLKARQLTAKTEIPTAPTDSDRWSPQKDPYKDIRINYFIFKPRPKLKNPPRKWRSPANRRRSPSKFSASRRSPSSAARSSASSPPSTPATPTASSSSSPSPSSSSAGSPESGPARSRRTAGSSGGT